jgi:hypothetical protein
VVDGIGMKKVARSEGHIPGAGKAKEKEDASRKASSLSHMGGRGDKLGTLR